MHVMFTEQELTWIDQKPFAWKVKKNCPKEYLASIQKKLDALRIPQTTQDPAEIGGEGNG